MVRKRIEYRIGRRRRIQIVIKCCCCATRSYLIKQINNHWLSNYDLPVLFLRIPVYLMCFSCFGLFLFKVFVLFEIDLISISSKVRNHIEESLLIRGFIIIKFLQLNPLPNWGIFCIFVFWYWKFIGPVTGFWLLDVPMLGHCHWVL